jgi:hypothetical protein
MIETATHQVELAREQIQTLLPYTLLDNLYSVLEDGKAKQRLDTELRGYFQILLYYQQKGVS